jgi:hypothetical protein
VPSPSFGQAHDLAGGGQPHGAPAERADGQPGYANLCLAVAARINERALYGDDPAVGSLHGRDHGGEREAMKTNTASFLRHHGVSRLLWVGALASILVAD